MIDFQICYCAFMFCISTDGATHTPPSNHFSAMLCRFCRALAEKLLSLCLKCPLGTKSFIQTCVVLVDFREEGEGGGLCGGGGGEKN